MKLSNLMKAISGVEDLEEMKAIMALLGVEFQDKSEDGKIKLTAKCEDGKLTIGSRNFKKFLKINAENHNADGVGIC